MKSRFRLRPPKHTLAQRSGSRMRPIILPSGAKTATPSSVWPPDQKTHTTDCRVDADAIASVPPGSALKNSRRLAVLVRYRRHRRPGPCAASGPEYRREPHARRRDNGQYTQLGGAVWLEGWRLCLGFEFGDPGRH